MKVLETRLGSKSDETCVYEGEKQGSIEGLGEIRDQSGRPKSRKTNESLTIGNGVFADKSAYK